MIVLSLFDGISCGLEALKKCGVKVDKYYSSEIDKYAIQVSKYNHPEIIRLGDIRDWKNWDIEKPDLIIGGSPCQGFSLAGKKLNFKDERSKLFFDFVDILKHYDPKYFLLENVKMKKQWVQVITSYMNVEPIEINSALISAQNRKRLYWTNISNVDQPKDKNIYLKDVLENGYCKIAGKRGRILKNTVKNKNQSKYTQCLEIRKDDKSNCLTTVQKDNFAIQKITVDDRYYLSNKMLNYLTDMTDRNGFIRGKRTKFIEDINSNKSFCLTLNEGNRPVSTFIKEKIEGDYKIRKLTPIECERLQTMPDNYTQLGINEKNEEVKISNTQRYKMLGNGWTLDVIAHIFKNLEGANG